MPHARQRTIPEESFSDKGIVLPVRGTMRAVIIGNGVAGVSAASLLADSPNVSVEMISDEEFRYYNRPHLLEFIAGRAPFESIFVYPEEWYAKKGIRTRLREKVLALDPSRKEISLGNGRVAFDKLILATGSKPNVPPIKGVEKKGVFTLRSARDALSIVDYSRNARRAVVIGGGLLGLEAAGALRSLGLQVTVVEFLKRLLPKQLDEEAALMLTSMIERIGIRVIVGGEVDTILGDESVSQISLKDGTRLEADLTLISAGVKPRNELAVEASLKVNRGILVDDRMQTSESDIYACGDAAEAKGKIDGIIPAAMDQSRIAAQNILGGSATYGATPYAFTLRLGGIKLASIGEISSSGGEYEERKNVDADRGNYTKLVFKDGVIVGAILLGDTTKLGAFKKLILDHRDLSSLKDSIFDIDINRIQ